MTEKPCPTLYTIGHSHHAIGAFLALLQQHEITLVVDVRSQPYSRWAPQFNREALQRALEAAGLRYRDLGALLGGRPSDPALYAPDSTPDHPKPDYARMAASTPFRLGLAALMEAAQRERAAVLCSEGDHEQCHRGKLLGPELLRAGWCVWHITPGGEVVAATLPLQQLSLF